MCASATCHFSCARCQGGTLANNCATCSDNAYRYLDNSHCKCLNGYFENNKTSCVSCHYKCGSCQSAEETACLSCAVDSNRKLQNNTCVCSKEKLKN